MKKLIISLTIIIFFILWPNFFFKDGAYFSLDNLFYPIHSLSGFFYQSFYWHIYDILNIFFWYKIYAKIYMLWTLIFWSLLWIVLWKLVIYLNDIKDKYISYLLMLFWVIFVLFNPFLYERLITQTGIALGTLFIWFGFIYLIFFILKQENKYFYLSSLFFWFSLNIYPHAIVIVSIIWIISLLFFLKKIKINILFIWLFIFFLLNFNWLIGIFVLKENKILDQVNNFNQLNIEVFKSNSLSNLWTELTHLLWYGFWAERYNHVYTPDVINPRWYNAGFVIFFIIILGFFMVYKKNKILSLYLLLLAILSYILSLGISSNIFYKFNNLFYQYIPYYIGMREPQKILWLTMIIYAIFFLFAMEKILKYIPSYIEKINFNKKIFNIYTFSIFIFLIILAWSPNMLFAFNWQLKIISYPVDYDNINKFLNKKEKILILPWHSYVACNWTYWKIIPNPAMLFLNDYNTIYADNIEIWNLYTNSKNPLSKKIEIFLQTKDFDILRQNNIKNILFMKDCADFKNYEFLDRHDNLQKILSWNYLDLYYAKY